MLNITLDIDSLCRFWFLHCLGSCWIWAGWLHRMTDAIYDLFNRRNVATVFYSIEGETAPNIISTTTTTTRVISFDNSLIFSTQ